MRIPAAIGIVLAFWAIGNAVHAAPLEAYGRLPSIQRAIISPDGRNLALTVSNGEASKIVIQDLATKAIVGNIDAGTQKVRWLQWAGPNHLIITISVTGYINGADSRRTENWLATNYDLIKRVQRPLLTGLNATDARDEARDSLNTLFGEPQVRNVGNRVVVFAPGITFVNGRGVLTLFRVDPDSGKMEIESRGESETNHYVIGAAGGVVARSDYARHSGQWTLFTWRGHWDKAYEETAPLDAPYIVGLGRDGASIAVNRPGKDHRDVAEWSLATNTWGSPLADAGEDEIFDAETGRIMAGVTATEDGRRTTFYEPKDQAVWTAIGGAYPGSRITLASVSVDRRKWVLRVDSPTDGPAYALVDLDAKKGSWIGDEFEGVKSADIGPVQVVHFTAKDGLPLSGYLTLPRDKPAKALPLVVLPHGGPAARDSAGFDWWAQGLASRGYAVLQVNYRGSDGLGYAFMARGFGEWGRKMQTDLSDGVRYLAATGIVDPARVCIVGGSYGGYAALAGVALESGVYRCAVSVAGVSDIRKMVDWSATSLGQQDLETLRYWSRYMGAAGGWDEISPALHADHVTAPVLLIHGGDDTVVPYAQSVEMEGALRRAGKPVELITLKSEDHWLSRGATRLEMLRDTVAFLEKNDPP